MGVYNAAFLNPKLRAKGSGVKTGILTDQLTMLENGLRKDGYLSPGDYDVLIAEAQKISTTPGLTPDQISGYKVKITGYEANKSTASLDKDQSIDSLDRKIQDELNTAVFMAGNNPNMYLQVKRDIYGTAIDQMQETIEQREQAGNETTEHYNKYQELLSEMREVESARAVQFDGKTPIAGYVAYVTTNDRGEIIDMKVDRDGGQTGYLETNGMIDGFQVYGKANSQQGGKNTFVMGNKMFQGVDMVQPDPNNPGTFKNSVLFDTATTQGSDQFTRAISQFSQVESNQVPIQQYVPLDGWAEGANGTVYNRRKDGGYTKYLNVNASIDGMPSNGVIKLPSLYERSIMGNADETVDFAERIMPDQGEVMTPMPEGAPLPGAGPQSIQPAAGPQSIEPKIARTKAPVDRAPKGILATAKRTIQSAREALRLG